MTQLWEKDFVFDFHDACGDFRLTAPVNVPLNTSVKEYACRVIAAHGIPCYVENELISALEAFVKKEMDEYYKSHAEAGLHSLRAGGDSHVDKLADSWSKAFREEHAAYAKPEGISNEVVFSEVYHSLVHSGALDALLTLEHSYAVEMENLIRERDADMVHLERSQSKEMEKAVEEVGISTTDEEVSALASRHFEDTQLLQSKWASTLSALHDEQKRQFVDWVMNVHEDYQTTGKVQLPEKLLSTRAIPVEDEWISQSNRMEESFTIHLGAQMKQMHNLRLLAADELSICWQKPSNTGGVLPQRLQTAMSLYSNNLCGMVFLVDNRINSYTGIKRDFANICQRSGEFHFPDIEDQLSLVRKEVDGVKLWRLNSRQADGRDPPLTPVDDGDKQGIRPTKLQTGDFYVTRHSNLSEVHVVFHLAVSDSLHSEITSRNPVILGLRNVLRVACMCDVTTLTLPLLLVHEMSEEMTISWCLKRAELVFKCIKGFMMEMASWGGSVSRTVQFIVPKGISEELFSNLATMLPSIFRMSNPLVAKKS